MRQEKELIIKTVFRALALRIRAQLDLTQREMAARLDMCERSYFDIEAGKSACGTLTVILLLMELEDPLGFLRELRAEFDAEYERQMVTV